MLAILSPAKKMRDVQCPEGLSLTAPLFPQETAQLAEELRQYAPWQLESLLKVNAILAIEAFDAYQSFAPTRPGTAALLAYRGLQYQHLAAETFSAGELSAAQSRLRILSGFYGLLRPLDGIQPYRLEMSCRGCPSGENLYKFWGSRLRDALFAEDDLVLNLASSEYSRAVIPRLRPGDRFVTVEFLTYRRGKLVTPATWAKMARGRLARKIVLEGLEKPEELTGFYWAGFQFAPALSSPDRLCFVRDPAQAAP